MTWNELCKKTPVFKIINIFIIIVLSMGFTYWLYGYLEGDSAIYFTYYKNFFDLPFSFSDKTVSFGATSPLYVVLNSFIYKLSGKYWLELCKFFSIFMFFLSAHIVACSMAENNSARIIIESIVNVILLLFCGDFIIYTSTCFETGLILLSVSLLITLDLRHEYNKAIVVSGFLYLVRPELILLTIIYDSYYLIKRKNRETFLRICVSGAPVAAYVIYMFLFTKQLLPSSIAGRFITSIEEPWSYSEKLDYFLSFICGKLKYLIFLTICAMVFAFIKKQWTLLRNTLFVLCPLFLPYIFFPPTNYRGLRYITPILTVIIMAANFLVNYVLIKIKDQKIYWIICFLALLYLGGGSLRNFTCSYPVIKNSRQRLDILLGKDLSEKLDRIAAPGTGVLVYEIQHQYYSHCHFYSMDAIVGSEFQNALMKRETLSEFYKRCGIKYVVTMDAMNYRKIFDNTAFETLYSFDKNAMVGERVLIDGVFYTKILHNDTPTVPMVTPNLNDQADTLDVFPEDSVWPGSSLFWNAVYRVEVRR